MLDDAWAILLAVVPDIDARVVAGTTSTNLVISVVSAMVLRVLRNPEGIRQWSVDDASFTRDNSLSAGGLFVSPEEVALLTGAASQAAAGAFTIRAVGAPVPVVDARRPW